jgi:leucyl aminopeptidase
MHMTYQTPRVRLDSGAPGELDTDLVVVPAFEHDGFADVPGLAQASGGEAVAARERGAFSGKPFESYVIGSHGSGWRSPRAVLVGAGAAASCSADVLRRVAITGALVARQQRLPRVAVLLRPGTSVSLVDATQAVVEGVTIANYEGASLKTADPPPVWLQEVVVAGAGGDGALVAAVERGLVLGDATNQARALANEPGNRLTPRIFAERGATLASAAGLGVEVLDEAAIARLKMGLLLSVAQGSQEPPRLLVLRHEPAGAVSNVTLGLIGKGITFDTGGISIKPAENMDKMKDDMSGGAAVIAAMAAIARLKLPVRCLGLVPMTENMPGGRAIKPGDVVTSAEGKTVEILNTDAEGRLVLGDALWYARQLGATHLVDLATLTGACVVALGKTTTGLFGRPQAWVDAVLDATRRAGDRSWPMPIFDDYKELLKSEIADFTNTGGRPGGAITGALFIKEFAGDLPWVHLDIAGTAWAEDTKPYQPKGATGVGVRTLIQLAMAAPAWGAAHSARRTS